jgi:hypothetical protein
LPKEPSRESTTAMKKSKIIVEQGFHDPTQYTVIKLVNRVQPEIGKTLTRTELERLMMGPNITVDIQPSKQSKR